MDIHGEEDESYNAKADVMRGRGVRHLLALITKGGGGLRQMLILADIRGRGVWTPHIWFTYVNSPKPLRHYFDPRGPSGVALRASKDIFCSLGIKLESSRVKMV